MKEIKIFDTNEEARKEIKKRAGIWRSLNTDFVNGKIKVTFVNGNDDPDNSQESQKNRKKIERRKDLKSKLDDNSINFDELKEYLRG